MWTPYISVISQKNNETIDLCLTNLFWLNLHAVMMSLKNICK